MDKDIEFYIEHEVRLRLSDIRHDTMMTDIQRFGADINEKFDKLDAKIDSRFMLLIGLILTSIALPVVMHSLGLV